MCDNLAIFASFSIRFVLLDAFTRSLAKGLRLMHPRNESIFDAVDDNGAHLFTNIWHIRESCK